MLGLSHETNKTPVRKYLEEKHQSAAEDLLCWLHVGWNTSYVCCMKRYLHMLYEILLVLVVWIDTCVCCMKCYLSWLYEVILVYVVWNTTCPGCMKWYLCMFYELLLVLVVRSDTSTSWMGNLTAEKSSQTWSMTWSALSITVIEHLCFAYF